jgi:undecaprenyl-diphosphatase
MTTKKSGEEKQVVRNPAEAPEQKLGDTPAAPWKKATPEQKAAVQPVKEALSAALKEIKTEADAEAALDQVAATAGGLKGSEVAASEPKMETAGEAAEAVKTAAETAPPGEKAAQTLMETAKAVETSDGQTRQAVAEAVQEAMSPEQQGAQPAGEYERRRELLHKALLHRLKPLQALDAELFIHVNHLPHTRLTNGFFYFITFIFSGGIAWYALMGAAMLARGQWDRHMARASAVPLTIATALVEFPIKRFFRRRRPFIDIVRAIVVGKKPGTWSFPSGHSASAFAGAWLLRQHFPTLTPLLYLVAGLVGFSRVYLGDHYPGDVVSGSVLGHLFAMGLGRLLGHGQGRAIRARSTGGRRGAGP